MVVVYTEAAEILLLRRHSPFDFWQSVTGSLNADEAPADAAQRELQEETGLTQDHCELIATSKDWLAYELPQAFRSPRQGRGQVHRWHLCRFTGQDSDIVPDGREFSDWKWLRISQLVADVVPFRRSVYQTVAADFADYLA